MNSSRATAFRKDYDVVIAGGGPAGLAAALGAREGGAENILIVDRENEAGGILWQCIHSGFGLHHFKEELTGPEYAQRFLNEVESKNIDIMTDAIVSNATKSKDLKIYSGDMGVQIIHARSLILAMGARERTRGAIRIPGTRPAGVLTAGLAQRFVNVLGYMPGRRVVILGSGDIGLIMARRLVLEGAEVIGVYEIMPHPNGSNRNIVQCLHDFNIPLHLSTTVVNIHGRERVEKVTVALVDQHLVPQLDSAWDIPCDTLLLSIGLIPENELARKMGVRLDPITGGPIVDSTMETTVDGVFACGNVLHIHDLVDFVSLEAKLAGQSAGKAITGKSLPKDNIRLLPGENVRYCVPHSLASDREHTVYMRVKKPLDKCVVRFGDVYEKKVRYVYPGEMLSVKMRPRFLESFHGDSLHIDVLPRS